MTPEPGTTWTVWSSGPDAIVMTRDSDPDDHAVLITEDAHHRALRRADDAEQEWRDFVQCSPILRATRYAATLCHVVARETTAATWVGLGSWALSVASYAALLPAWWGTPWGSFALGALATLLVPATILWWSWAVAVGIRMLRGGR